MNLSRIKVNGTRLVTATDIILPSEFTPLGSQNIRGIKLNGNAVIDFQSYNKCGPGKVTTDEAINGCDLLITSDAHSRLDMNCNKDDEENSPYIPYRGVAGIMRAAAFAGIDGARSIAVNYDFEENPSLSSKIPQDQESGTFGYPFGITGDGSVESYPGIAAESYNGVMQISPNEYMARLLFPVAYSGSWEGPYK